MGPPRKPDRGFAQPASAAHSRAIGAHTLLNAILAARVRRIASQPGGAGSGMLDLKTAMVALFCTAAIQSLIRVAIRLTWRQLHGLKWRRASA